MDRDLKAILISSALLAAAVLLQSTLLRWVALKGVKPDLALVVMVFVAVRRGSMSAQLAGFLSGLTEDLLSLSPLGFHAMVRTTLGFLYGLTEGSIFMDPILVPVLLTLTATVLKGLLGALMVVIFGLPAAGFRVFAGPLWIEAGYNLVLAPFLFAVLRLIRAFRPRDKERV
jgi:rod shape-determining protein MreD